MTRKCYICGCVKSCSFYLDRVFENIIAIGGLFDEYTIIIYFDKSEDDSLEKLFFFKNKYRDLATIHILINYDNVSEYRTLNIAKGRNKIMEFMKKEKEKDGTYEYFIMMDMDDVCAHMTDITILKNYLHEIHDGDWDALTFNKDDYYDIWALSIGPFHFSCWHFLDRNKKNSAVRIEKKYITTLLNTLQKDQLLGCNSAFNGFAIYRMNKFSNCTYNGNVLDNFNLIGREHIDMNEKYLQSKLFVDPNNIQDCEHRSFHYEAIFKNKAKIRISPLKLFK